MRYATAWFSYRLPQRGHLVKEARCNFGVAPPGHTTEGMKAVPTRQSSTNFDLVAPIKARACDALSASAAFIVRTKPRKPGTDSPIMRKGAERC